MKVFVATEETQGHRKNDFCHVPEGELVTFGFECDGESVDGSCGCRRSLSGLKCGKATTTFKVVERAMTVNELAGWIMQSLVDGGWGKLGSDKELADLAYSDAEEIARLANGFPTGAVVEKRGNTMGTRTVPK